MGFSSILCAVRSDAGDGEIGTAISFARSSAANLTVLLISVAAPPPVGAHMESVWRPWLDERESDQVNLRTRVTQVENLLALSTVPHRVSEAYTELFHIDNIVGQEARYADLVIVGPEMLRDPAVRDAVIDGALFHENVPVLLFPDECVATDQPGNIVIAWNDSSEAAHAVRQGRSMLSSAGQVIIAMVDPDDEVRKSASDLSNVLQRCNVSSRINVLRSDGLTVEELLQDFVREEAADLLIMGAYGHSRLRERIFGGVTRAVLENPKCPIFLASVRPQTVNC